MIRRPIIIDCDPGLDDTIALFMAIASDNFDIKGVTAVAGNQTLPKISKNALQIVDFAGSNAPVVKGADRPLIKEAVTAEHVHGETGLGDIVLPDANKSFLDKKAWDFIYEEAIKCNGELEIIAIGPLTNIAITLLKYPNIKYIISRIIIMGGSCGLGNDTPAAEFNIYADPDAAKIVFESGVNLTMVGLDATHKTLLYEEEIEQISKIDNKVAKVATRIFKNGLTFSLQNGFTGAVQHDPMAMAFAIDETLMKSKKYFVGVETKGEFTRGKTVVDIYNVTGKAPNAAVGIDVDREGFVVLLKKLLEKYNE